MMTQRVFSRTRLQLARSFRGLTQTELAELVGVSQQFIGYVETGRKAPAELLASALGEALGVEPDFFFAPPPEEFRVEEWSFRRYQTTPVSTMSRLAAHGALLSMLVEHLDSKLKLPKDDVPALTNDGSREGIERCAERCRVHWGLGHDLPTKNITRTLERAGVVVSLVRTDSVKVDAFSRPGRRSVVLLNTDKGSASRRVFDLGHECGHLVMHVGMETGTPEREDEANLFSSAFLLPRSGFLREFPKPPQRRWSPAYWRDLFELKKRWRASVAAIVRRAFDLKLIDAIHYQRAYKHMSARGWLHSGEPPSTEPEMESPELLPSAFSVLRSRLGLTPTDVARALHWTKGTLELVVGVSFGPDEQEPEAGGKVLSLVSARGRPSRPPPQPRR